MKRFVVKLTALAAALGLLMTGCAFRQGERKQYQASFLTLFDTVTYISGFADSEAAFSAQAEAIYEELLVYHRLFDIYNEYEGINNLKTVNDMAGIAPVTVDGEIIRLLTDCRYYYALTSQRVNVAMGSVLSLWHEARSDGLDDPASAKLPDADALEEASLHCDWDDVIVDAEASTVYLADPQLRLDVGAVAKGWSAQQVARNAPVGLLISVGGNVCATGPKDADGTPWVVGITDPEGESEYLHTLYITDQAVVTSGDYQRCYVVEGKVYHHIIDPDTLYPGELWRAVTVVCSDSGLADALSTALFLMSREDGQQLLDQCGAEAMWMDADRNLFYSSGFDKLIRN